MIKEIYEQKNTIAQNNQSANEDEILKIAEEIRRARTFLIGCGTAHKVALAGEYFSLRLLVVTLIPLWRVNFLFFMIFFNQNHW